MPPVVARDAVRDAVDLDQQVVALPRGHRPVRPRRRPRAGARAAREALEPRLDRCRRPPSTPVAARADLADGACGSDWPRWRSSIVRAGARRSTAGARGGRSREARPVDGASLRRRGRSRPAAARRRRGARRDLAAGAPQAVEPAWCRSRRSRTSGRSSSSSRKPLLVVPPSITTVGLGQRAAQAGQRLGAVAAPGDRPWRSSSRTRRARRRPRRRRCRRGCPGRRGGAVARSAPAPGRIRAPGPRRSAAPRWRGRADGGGSPSRRPPRRHVQLQLHQVEPGRHLGHRMLDLQAGVHLHERRSARARVVEELDRAGVAVAGAQRSGARRRR